MAMIPSIGWQLTATAGRRNPNSIPDTDGDLLPDFWEMAYFGSLVRSGSGDFDHDGQTDPQEYIAGTSPVDPSSCHKIDPLNLGGSGALIHFNAVAGKTRSLLYLAAFGSGTWQKRADVPSRIADTTFTVIDPVAGSNGTRFYRLATLSVPRHSRSHPGVVSIHWRCS
jgi:hypothetical protein